MPLRYKQTSNHTYSYDAGSRLKKVTDGTNSATYFYVANSPLVSQIVFTNVTSKRMTTTRDYDNLNRLTSLSSVNASSVVLDSHGYGYNSANQRASVTNADGTYWVYQYDALGQVTAGIKYWNDGAVVAGQQFGYAFDDIGNRTSATSGGDQYGHNTRESDYTANSLNQYTQRTVPGKVGIIGSATNNATVTVNGQTAYRRNDYFWGELSLNNSSALWQSVTNLAVLNQGTSADIVATNIGNVFVSPATESYSYDADGNLTQDGRWTYTWDGENRLANMTSLGGNPTNSKLELDFVYNYKGRRVQKLVSAWTGSSYAPQMTNRFVYDGWNLIGVLDPALSPQATFMWGLDLSGTMQGAGGVGGLLGITQYAPTNQQQFVCYDGNGNVTTLIDASSSAITGQYEYGPFGETIRVTGTMVKVNPFRVSTIYQDDETDMLMYLHRPYSASQGRWLSRDPIGELSFYKQYTKAISQEDKLKWLMQQSLKSPYLFVLNDPNDRIDIDGAAIGPVNLTLWGDCSNPDVAPAVKIANELIKNNSKCAKWFKDHGANGDERSVVCVSCKIPCWVGAQTYTVYGFAIAVCPNNVKKLGPAGIASLLIHEAAHHYCPLILFGGESCAESAQEACSD